ncbi:hypothetical protein QMT40_001776 [Parvibaculaceae bacterium PLY_AMNH_Bact1]|nr:hypothetical protein QMT40_001776 [Parvibaculaceae bacterium PLY_AMNH_Bact1]
MSNFQRYMNFDQAQRRGEAALDAQTLSNDFNAEANPTRLRSIVADAGRREVDTRIAEATEADKVAISGEAARQAPIATDQAQHNLDHARNLAPHQVNLASATATAGKANAAAARMRGFYESLNLVQQGNIPAARQVAAAYGEEIPEEILTNTTFLAQVSRIAEAAQARHPNSPANQEKFIQTALEGLQHETLGQERTADPTFVYNVPGAPEPATVAGTDDAASRKMQALIQGGVEPEQARKIAYGQLRIHKDPVTNEVTLVDLGTNEIVPLRTQGAQEEPVEPVGVPTPGSEETLYGGADNAVGAVPTVVDLLSGVTGQFSDELTAPDVTAARQNFNTAQNELIRALSVNPRFPVAEMTRIREEIAIDKGIFNSPERARLQMSALDSSLRRRLVQEQETSVDNSMPVEARKNARQAANDISRFLEVMGVPQIDQMSVDELNAMDPASMTETEIKRASDRLDLLLGGASGTSGEPTEPAQQPPQMTQGEAVRVQSQEEFDALPSGSLFINPSDGRTLRKN